MPVIFYERKIIIFLQHMVYIWKFVYENVISLHFYNF